MKYKNWWRFNVIRIVREYPNLRDKKDALQSQSITASYSAEPRGGNTTSRRTENAALRELPPAEETAIRAVEKALEKVALWRDGDRAIALIHAYYFKRDGRLGDVAPRFYISEEQARRKNGVFLRYVAQGLGYIKDDGQEQK